MPRCPAQQLPRGPRTLPAVTPGHRLGAPPPRRASFRRHWTNRAVNSPRGSARWHLHNLAAESQPRNPPSGCMPSSQAPQSGACTGYRRWWRWQCVLPSTRKCGAGTTRHAQSFRPSAPARCNLSLLACARRCAGFLRGIPRTERCCCQSMASASCRRSNSCPRRARWRPQTNSLHTPPHVVRVAKPSVTPPPRLPTSDAEVPGRARRVARRWVKGLPKRCASRQTAPPRPR
mmetsp:Transcript_175381/g.562615  ORF Transcript_175381/g.562615 Transcript_175381/m.562615 type:complete len:232 (-) Transcript_175381:1747-2442(-)